MAFFSQNAFVKQLYLAESGSGDGFLALLLPEGASGPSAIDLTPTLLKDQQDASLIFSAALPELDSKSATETFVSAVHHVIQTSPAHRGLVWLPDLEKIKTKAEVMGVNTGGTRVNAALNAALSSALDLVVPAGMSLKLEVENGDQASFVMSGSSIRFSGPAKPDATVPTGGTVPLTGAQRGTIGFQVFFSQSDLSSKLRWGFQFLFPKSTNGSSGNTGNDDPPPAISEWLPLADSNAAVRIGFQANLDPSDVNNAVFTRSGFTFSGKNFGQTPTELESQFRTTFGATVTLVPATGGTAPARLVFNQGEPVSASSRDFHLAPDGDFVLKVDGATSGQAYDLLCGMSGTEYLGFHPRIDKGYAGDRLRFFLNQPAFAANYPFPHASPVGPPSDPEAPLLDKTYMTSWATVVRAPSAGGSIPYVAQPKGSSLYGHDDLIYAHYPSLFGSKDPSVKLPASGLAFPLVPYSGASPGGTGTFSAEQTEDFERQVVGPTRRQAIGVATAGHAPSARAALEAPPEHAKGVAATTTPPPKYNATTPAGLIATVDGSTWSKILLGQNLQPSQRQMYFCKPDAELQQAFQTNQLFLVVANAKKLGTFSNSGDGSCGTGSEFHNQMNIGQWQLAALVGQTRNQEKEDVPQSYGDYHNIVIVKGRKGALYDPTSDDTRKASLVSNPEKWTQRKTFASPTTASDPDTPDPTQQVIVSQWLQDYFLDASQQPDSKYFGKFNTIAKDPNWTGILVLRMTIAELPTDLAGITAGITDFEQFNAHHFAIEIGQVKNKTSGPIPGPVLDHSSSMFGLIYYVDPSFTPPKQGEQAAPVPPPAGVDYDFRLLSLKVLFENTAVQSFNSYAQITLNKLFDMPVTAMGGDGANPYNTLVLSGSYQNNGGQPVYSLGSSADNTFSFASNVFNEIEVTSAQMSTRDPGTGTGTDNPCGQKNCVVSWFGLTGFLDFQIVDYKDEKKQIKTFDVLSFGSPTNGQPLPRQGLAFSNLGLQMSFPQANPEHRNLAFVSDEISFDLATSTPRDGSLYVNFALDLQNLTSGDADSPPSKGGYLPVIALGPKLTGVDGGSWYGLSYRLAMGTPGDLAGKVNLTSYLITAWAPDSDGAASYKLRVGLELPGTGGGAKLISLQTVLSLSIGNLWLAYDTEKKSFLLQLSDIALKFLGMLKLPPSGNTQFYLFGNPASEGKPSGLGWYAMYNKEKPEGDKSLTENA